MWKFNVYYDGGWLHEETDFETEEEAIEEAQIYIDGKKEDWEFDRADWEDDLFYIETVECEEMESEDE